MALAYLQMWRERLGRQKAQAEALELRVALSSQRAEAGGAARDAELDEAIMRSLEQVRPAGLSGHGSGGRH